MDTIVLDTNVWTHGTRLLRTPLAVAFLHCVARENARILLPEIVRREIHIVVQRDCQERVTQITKALADLRTLLARKIPDIQLPNEQAISTVVDQRLSDCKAVVSLVPLTLEQSRAALERVYHKQPPSDREEQFRDAVIWEVVREAAEQGPVYFVTQDSAFYKDRSYKLGLAENLAADVDGRPVAIAPDLTGYLTERGEIAALPTSQQVIAALEEPVRRQLYALDNERVLYLEQVASAEVTPFLTDHPARIAYQFALTYLGHIWLDKATRKEGKILVLGEALVETNMTVLEVDLHSINVDDGPAIPFGVDESRRSFLELPSVTVKVSTDPSRRRR